MMSSVKIKPGDAAAVSAVASPVAHVDAAIFFVIILTHNLNLHAPYGARMR
jgi:hypothetical protein